MTKRTLLTLALGAAALVGTSLATVETASARGGGGGFHGGGFGGFHGGGFHGGGFGGFHGGGFGPGLRGGASPRGSAGDSPAAVSASLGRASGSARSHIRTTPTAIPTA